MISRLPLFITRNFRLKLIAVVVACGMWVGVVYASDPPAIQTYSVHVQPGATLHAGLVLPKPIGAIAVKIAGVSSHVRSSSEVSSHLSATADLSHITKPGEYQVSIKVLLSDSNVWIWSAPKTLEVLVDKETTRSIPVHLVVSSAPPVGFTFNQAQSVVTPADVTVSGPDTVLANIQAEAIVDLSSIRTSLAISEPVKLVNANGPTSEVTVTPSLVSVAVAIASENTEAELPVRPTFSGSGQPPSGYEVTGIQVEPLTVIAAGPASVVTLLSSIATQPIDLSHATSSETVNVQLVTPAGTSLSTGSVSVVITIAPVASSSPTPSPTPTPTP
ncbi:MAG: CdaR family protein [Candidatus Dormiibacterota bacterium]